jgi:hypothetical protein
MRTIVVVSDDESLRQVRSASLVREDTRDPPSAAKSSPSSLRLDDTLPADALPNRRAFPFVSIEKTALWVRLCTYGAIGLWMRAGIIV